jgi:Tfp pilus assembly protein PilX
MNDDLLNRPHATARGSALVLVMVLLAVLAIIGAASVSLGSRERINSSAKGTRDRMAACANAARLMVWAELAKFGSAHLRAALTESRVTLSNGTTLSAPAHYAAEANDPLQVIELRRFVVPLQGAAAGAADVVGLTNSVIPGTAVGGNATTAYAFVARCRDRDGRETEVEFSTGLMF